MTSRTLAPLLVAALALSCVRATAPPPQPQAPAPLDQADELWVFNTLASMSLEERVGQMLLLRLPGTFENQRSAALKEAERFVDDAHVGGFLVGAGSPLDIALKLNHLQQRARLPLIFAADLEWGAGMRLLRPYVTDGTAGGGTAFPFNMGIAATGDPALAELAGRVTAAEARAVGIHWVLAPVMDVNTDPDNPAVNVRSYGSDPATVATFGSAFIRGANAGGVLTTAKHFPGYGDARVPATAAVPVIDIGMPLLEQRELRPFRAAISAGVSSIMLGHIAMPALTKGLNIPATLAPEMATDLLRRWLDFNGIIVTDVMNTPALRELSGYSPGEIAVRAVQAGADVVLSPPDPLLAHHALVRAVRNGRIQFSRVDSSVVRILRAKARVGLHHARIVSLDSVTRIVDAPEHESVAADIAARSLTLVRDSALLLPLDPRRIRNLAVIAFTSVGDVRGGAELADELTRIYGRGVTLTRLDEHSGEMLQDSAIARAARADATVFATFLLAAATRGQSSVPESARRLALRLRRATQRTVVVSFGDPYGPSNLAGATTYMLAWQPHGTHAQRTAARALAGRIPIPGHLPIELSRAPGSRGIERPPTTYGLEFARPEDVGMDPVLLARVDSIIKDGILRGATPGASVAIGRHGKLVRLTGYGVLDRRPGSATVTDSSVYDMASITKVVATTTALMMLIDQGLIDIDDPVKKYLPEWRGTPAKERVTIRNLLVHNSGLASYGALWAQLVGREQYRRRITAMSLEYEPGTRTVYSDFGIILLGFIVEQVSGQPLDVLMRERLFAPLGMRDTGFNPARWPYARMALEAEGDAGRNAPEPLGMRIAPTEIDTVYRMRHIVGEVHDENAHALGGVAGHAGLFSSARDMAIFAQLMLNRGFYGGQRFVDPATLERFTKRQSESSSRALGWDTPEGVSSAGSYFSASSYGHTGFTGTSIWIDPERDVFVVLLTNRVNPTRENQRHTPLRRAVADAVQLSITDMPVTRREDGSHN